MNTIIIPIKKYLDELRINANFSDEEIGRQIGLVRQSVWRLRNGKHTVTTLETGMRIEQLHARVFRRKKKA